MTWLVVVEIQNHFGREKIKKITTEMRVMKHMVVLMKIDGPSDSGIDLPATYFVSTSVS